MVVMDIDRAHGSPWEAPEPDAPRTLLSRPEGRPSRSRSIRHARSHWQPLAGGALLERLRITGRPRPAADPDLLARLRHSLERGLDRPRGGNGPAGVGSGPHGGSGQGPGGPTLIVTKDKLTRALACEAHRDAAGCGKPSPSVALACGALVDALFRQLVTVGSIDDPMADGMAALSVDDRQSTLVSWIERMPGAEQAGLRAEVERQAEGLLCRWPRLGPTWLPRTQEPVRAVLAGGAVELSARVDLAIGEPMEDQASVAIVEIKSGARRAEHRADLHFSALIEALRSQAPPFVVATYYTRTGELDVDPVTEELLVAAGRRTLIGARVLQASEHRTEVPAVPAGLCCLCERLPQRATGAVPAGAGADRPADRRAS